MPSALDERMLENRLREVTEVALRSAGMITAVVGGLIVMICLLAHLFLPQPQLLVAAKVATLGFLLGVAVRSAASRAQRLLAEGLVVASTALPTAYFIFAGTAVPLGTVSGVLGPVAFLYGFLVACSGLLLRPILPILAGALAAAQFLLVYASVKGSLLQADLDPALRFELTHPLAWTFRALFIAAVGVASAGTTYLARRLLGELLAQQREALSVTRLFGQFVSTEVKDKILRDRANLRGERRQLVVMFADLRGFTAWSERTDPADVVDSLNRYFAAMVEVIEREGGIVDKFIGDAVMATFGGLVPLEQPAAAALRAAAGMQRALTALNAARERTGLPKLSMGVGVHYGAVLQGPLGPERRREFTVIGDAVNVASRLEGLTKELGFAVVVSQALVEALPPDHPFPLVAIGAVPIKGKSEPIRVWALPSDDSFVS